MGHKSQCTPMTNFTLQWCTNDELAPIAQLISFFKYGQGLFWSGFHSLVAAPHRIRVPLATRNHVVKPAKVGSQHLFPRLKKTQLWSFLSSCRSSNNISARWRILLFATTATASKYYSVCLLLFLRAAPIAMATQQPPMHRQ